MRREHTEKKSANRGIDLDYANDKMIGIARKHGMRMMPQNNTHLTKPKRRNRKPKKTTNE
jgi:hypothetical protein